LSQFKKYRPSGNLKFYNLGIFKSFDIAYFSEKKLPISLKLNFTPNTLGCKGLSVPVFDAYRVNSNTLSEKY